MLSPLTHLRLWAAEGQRLLRRRRGHDLSNKLASSLQNSLLRTAFRYHLAAENYDRYCARRGLHLVTRSAGIKTHMYTDCAAYARLSGTICQARTEIRQLNYVTSLTLKSLQTLAFELEIRTLTKARQLKAAETYCKKMGKPFKAVDIGAEFDAYVTAAKDYAPRVEHESPFQIVFQVSTVQSGDPDMSLVLERVFAPLTGPDNLVLDPSQKYVPFHVTPDPSGSQPRL